jgi:uncharacterized membrane protein YfcA
LFEQVCLLAISLISNIFSAFSGGGAGVIQLPAILLLFNITFINALAVHKIATVALGIGATSKFAKTIAFKKDLFIKLLLAGLPGVFIGAQLISFTNDQLARLLLGILIISISLYSFKIKNHGEREYKYSNTIANNLIGYSLIFLTGFLNGSLSAGTGLIFTIILISWYGMDYKKAIAYTLVIVGIFFNALGAITLGLIAEIEWMLLPALFFGSLIGGYLGAKISLSKSNRTIKIIYQTITITVGISLIV